MKLLKIAALGVLLASAAWLPSFANGFDEANQVSQDPHVAYTLYIGMPTKDAEAAFDELKDWKKSVEDLTNGCYTGPASKKIYYARTLKDKTKQKVFFFRNYDGILYGYQITFYTNKNADAEKMYNQAVKNLKAQLGAPHRTMSNSTNEWTNFEESDGYNINLTYNKQEKSFKIDRHYVYH